MEENNNQEKDSQQTENTGYTGEYGNSVEGDYQGYDNQSTYRYSYKNGEGESTHSGDYYAGQNNSGQASQDSAQTAQQTQENNANAWQSAGTEQNSGYQSAGSQNNTYQNNGNQNGNYSYQNYQNNGYQNAGYNAYQNPKGKKPKKERKPLSTGKKFLVTAACAVLFGVIAGVVFNGVNYVSDKLLGPSSASVQLEKTTTTDQTAKQKDSSTSNNGNSGTKTTGTTDVSSITEQSMPAIVAITSTTQGADYYDLFGQYYQGQDSTSCGSGFIVGQNKKELLIATNNHVIDGAKTISVQFIDGEIYEAEKKGADSANDLAVIAVKTASVKKSTMNQIKIADLGDSTKTKVGEMVIAIGNALGYGQSVTVGYISAKDREITESSEDGQSQNKIKAIQTDAAINPGNSGGALINMQGQVIGINSAKIASSSVEGVGYAIPISVATPIIDELMNRESLSDSEKGYLGISGKTVTQEAVAYNVPYGVYVSEVAKGGAADKGGIKSNDVITAINKMEVTTIESLQEKVNGYRKGTKIEVTLQRSNNGKYQEKKVTVTLQGKESLDNLSSGSSSKDSQNNNSNNNDSNNNNQGNSGSDNNNQGNNNSGNDQNQGNGNSGNNNSQDDDNSQGSGGLWDFFSR